MERAEHAAAKEDDRRQQDRRRRDRHPHQPHLHEQRRDDRGGEHLEDAFDPQVDDPPAPIFHDRDVRVLAVEQARAEQQADRNGSDDDEENERPPAFLLQRRPQAAQDQRRPQQQADEQIDLPEAAEVEIFVALVAEPEVQRADAHVAVDRQPFAGERADDDDQQADEQEVDAEALELRLASAEQRRDVEAGGEPRGRDPQHRELGVPGAGDGIGEIFRHRQAVEALALDRVMRGDDAEQHLGEEQGRDHEEIFRGRPHRWRDRRAGEHVGRGEAFGRLDVAPPHVELARVIPDQPADPAEQHEDRDERPQEDRSGRACCRPAARAASCWCR